jgi:hypothetical protein
MVPRQSRPGKIDDRQGTAAARPVWENVRNGPRHEHELISAALEVTVGDPSTKQRWAFGFVAIVLVALLFYSLRVEPPQIVCAGSTVEAAAAAIGHGVEGSGPLVRGRDPGAANAGLRRPG